MTGEDLRSQRLELDAVVRHTVDDVDTQKRMRMDRLTFQTTGKDPDKHPGRFFAFRAEQRGWKSSFNDGADRYPEHIEK